MQSNDMAGIQFRQPKDFAERFGVAEQCSIKLDMKSPVLIDNIANKTCEDYAAFPDRLYIVDMEGKVAYKGGRGPFGYKPKEMEQSLLMLMMEVQIKSRQETSASKQNSSISAKEKAAIKSKKPIAKPPTPPDAKPPVTQKPKSVPSVKKAPNSKPDQSQPEKKKVAPKQLTPKKTEPNTDKTPKSKKKNGKPQVNRIVGR